MSAVSEVEKGLLSEDVLIISDFVLIFNIAG